MEEEQVSYYDSTTLNKTLASTFFWMFLGVVSTAVIAAITYFSGIVEEIAVGWIGIGIMQIVIALLMGFLIHKMPVGLTTFLFFLYSMLTGLTFSVIFVAFDLTTIVYALAFTAGLYGVLAWVGYRTNADLTKFGRVLLIALLLGLVLTVINIFIGSTALDIIMDWVILAIFAGLTIYDMNKVKVMAEQGVEPEKVAIYGAFQLYLDFINIFIRILSIMGRRD